VIPAAGRLKDGGGFGPGIGAGGRTPRIASFAGVKGAQAGHPRLFGLQMPSYVVDIKSRA